MKNDEITLEYVCPLCKSNIHKRIPSEYNKQEASEFHEDWYFCVTCGMHSKFTTSKLMLA